MTRVTTKGTNIEGLELTTKGMTALFTRMGYANIATGSITNGTVTLDIDKLNAQGFMPILTGVEAASNSGHWMMLIKGEDDQYFLFDPQGEESARNYYEPLENHLYARYNLSIIPTPPDLSMGLCGYWVASAGLKACAALKSKQGFPDLTAVAQAIAKKMQDELEDNGYQKIRNWLLSIANGFPGNPVTAPQPDATALRHQAEKNNPALTNPNPKSDNTDIPDWTDFSLYTDPIVKHAIQHAHDNYLGTPYKRGNLEATPAKVGGITVYRQHHGLAHTLRTMAYSEVIVEEARKAKQRGDKIGTFPDGRTLADVTPNELRKTLIAQAFFVAGREGEESDHDHYTRYHQLSRKGFLNYIEANKTTLIPDVFKDQKEIDHFADIVEDKKTADGKSLWGASPEHMLVNQAHMVDLVRVKQPPESYLASFYNALKPWVGAKGAEAVFATQREFFHATYENVTGFDSASKEPHLVTSGLGRYLVINDEPVRDPVKKGQTKGDLTFYSQTYKLKNGERFMRVDEYLKLNGSTFPGYGKTLEGGYPGLTALENLERYNSKERGLCETNVDYCLAQLESAYRQTKLSSIKKGIQDSPTSSRREANADEFAAVAIIKQILANPHVIEQDQVQLNGQRLDEQFFRTLLAQCDMDIVGSLLDEKDIAHVDKLMDHEKNTSFHSTGTPVSTRFIGDMWKKEYRKNGSVSVEHALVGMMQDGAWYYTRLNAIAQSRDTGSTFKEVLLTALLLPATTHSIAIAQPKNKSAKPPKRLYRGMALPQESVERLLAQSESIIANSVTGLFSDFSAELYKEVQINGFSQMLANTCLSTSSEVEAGAVFGNILADIDDPDGLLLPKYVGKHTKGSESEYSIYLPDDVALVPIQVIKASAGKPPVIRLTAVKSPDFLSRIESGYAINPLMKIQESKLADLIKTFHGERSTTEVETRIAQLKNAVAAQIQLSIRGFWDKLSHRMTLTDDGKISAERKEFFDSVVFPLLQECQTALQANRMDDLKTAFGKFPTDEQWSQFQSKEANIIQEEMNEIKRDIEIKISTDGIQEASILIENKIDQLMTKVLTQSQLPVRGFWEKLIHRFTLHDDGKISAERKEFLGDGVLPLLTESQTALQKNDMDMLKAALIKFPTDKQWAAFKSEEAIKLKAELDEIKHEIQKKILVEDKINPALAQCKNELDKKNIPGVLKALQSLPQDNEWPETQEGSALRNFLNGTKIELEADLTSLQQAAPATKLIGDIEQMKNRYQSLLAHMTSNIFALEQIEDVVDIDNYKNIPEQVETLAKELDFLRTEKARIDSNHLPIDFSEIEALEVRLEKINENLVSKIDILVDSIKEQLELMTDPKAFHANEPLIDKSLARLKKYEKTLHYTQRQEGYQTKTTELRSLLEEKQRNYPHLVQLQLKKEALIAQLHQICINHHKNLDAQKTPPATGVARYITGALFAIDCVIRVDHYLDAKFEAQQRARLKFLLSTDLFDMKQITHKLAKRSSIELQQGLGLSPESADELYELLTQLNDEPPADEAQIKEQSALLDSLSISLRKEPVVPPVEETNDEEEEEEDVFRI